MVKKSWLLISFIVLVNCIMAQDLTNPEKQLSFVIEISRTYPDSALNILSDIEKNILESKNYLLIADMYRRKANCYYYKSDFSTAKEIYLEALIVRQSGNISQIDSVNQSEIANLYYNIAIVSENMGDYPGAIDYAKKLEGIYKNLKDYSNLSFRCYNYIAKLYYSLGDFENALKYSDKEIEMTSRYNDKLGLSYAYDFQAVLEQGLGENKKALELQLIALDIREQLGDTLLISYSYNNIGSTYLREKDCKLALEYFEKSLNLKLKYSMSDLGATYNNMGLTYQEMGQFDKSEDYYIKSYNFCKENNQPLGIATSAINLGVIYHIQNNNIKAERYFVEVLNIGHTNGYKNIIVDATEYAHPFYYDLGLYKDAYDMLLMNMVYSDSIKNEVVIKEIAIIEAEHIYNQKQIADSIMYHQQTLRDDERHKEEVKRKEQLLWILGITFLFIIFIIFALFKAYQLRKRNDENLLKQQALEIERNLLRSQMNPHFIFNAMNSIQSFIAENDTYSALKYLSKFAKLIRLILENSMHQTIPLQDEMQSLDLYMELEKVRFNNKFDFKFNIDENINEDNIQVPPMLIQPFVENAIIHGIMSLEKEGLIEINLSAIEEHDVLKCEVIDNGIGRDASAKLKNSQGKKHKSIGMQVSRQRLESLNKQTQKLMSYDVSDIMCDGKVCGTKVSLLIPYISEF